MQQEENATSANVQSTVIAEKSTYVFVISIIMIVIGAVVGIGFIAVGVILLKSNPIAIGAALMAVGVLIAGILFGFYVPQLVILCGSPKALIVLNDLTYTCWCGKKLGYVNFETDRIRSALPASGIWNSNLIMLLIGHYDAALKITDVSGNLYKIPYVRDVRTIANNIQNFCAQVNLAKAQAAAVASAQQPDGSDGTPRA